MKISLENYKNVQVEVKITQKDDKDMFFLSGRNAKMKLLKKQKNCDYLRNISHFRLKLIEYTGFVPLVSMAHQKFRILEQIGRKESFSFFSSKVVYMRGNQILWVVM